ncbi:MAG: hypothetical protein KGN84_01150 [Acidobacteriota bacterium]|nr:hypothetical protein [Acidobacteriota bacterium]
MNTLLLTTGLLSVYFGYKLFCGISGRTVRMTAGALLAVFGMAILAGEARAFVSQRSVRTLRIERSPNWHNESAPVIHTLAHHEEIV